MVLKDKFAAAIRRFVAFHGFEPTEKTDIVAIDMKGPEVGCLVGQVLYIGYVDLTGKKYMHKFAVAKNRPLLYASSDGLQLYIGKGRYRFTDRGIV